MLWSCDDAPSFQRLDDVGFVDVGTDAVVDLDSGSSGPEIFVGCSLLTPDRCERLGSICCRTGIEVCVPSLGAPNRCVAAGLGTAGARCAVASDCASRHLCVALEEDGSDAECRRVCAEDSDCSIGACTMGLLAAVDTAGVCVDAADRMSGSGKKCF